MSDDLPLPWPFDPAELIHGMDIAVIFIENAVPVKKIAFYSLLPFQIINQLADDMSRKHMDFLNSGSHIIRHYQHSVTE